MAVDIDTTDFDQLRDSDDFVRRSIDSECTNKDYGPIYVLERRIDRHRKEIDEIKAMVEKNSSDTSEILEIVKLGKGFFKVLGWLGTAAKTVIAVGAPVAAAIYWVKYGRSPP